MTFSNRITRVLDRLAFLPEKLRWRAFTLAFARIVPFVGTAGIRIESVVEGEVVLSLANRRRVHNHLKGVHASAMVLLAETASGLIIGRNVPDAAVPLIKTLHVAFTRRASGSFRAVATLTPAQIATLRTERKGELAVPVILTDETGNQPVECQMIWAWIPRGVAA